MKHIRQWMKSWTINFGLLLQVGAAVQAYVDTWGDPVITLVISIIIIALRFKTTKPVYEK